MREHTFESGDFELLLSELFPFMDRKKMCIKDLVVQMKNYKGDVSTRLIDMMTSVIVRTQNVFVLKSFKKLSPVEKVQMFASDVLKPLYKLTYKFEQNHSNYNVYVVDVIPDIASTMKCFER